MFDQILIGINSYFSIINIVISIIGTILGIVVGAMPGLGPTMAVSVLVPVTFAMEPASGMILLMAVFCGAVYGGSISAILLNVPGTPANLATSWDGNALSKKGYPKKALTTAIHASFIGGFISSLALLFFSPVIAELTLKFGPQEFVALAVWGLSIIISLESESLIKGIITACLGLLVATIGISPEQGTPRYVFGINQLYSGFSFIPVMIGLFCLPEVLSLIVSKQVKIISKSNPDDRNYLNKKELKKILEPSIVNGVLGTIIGAIPGAGGTIASFIGYNNAKSRSKTPEEFGKGCLEGIAGPESANNGGSCSSLIPLLTLGIPGSATAVVFLGALTIHGLQPGPLLFNKNPEVVYSLFIGTIVIQFIMLATGILGAPQIAKVTKMPISIMAPFILILCTIGSYAINGSLFQVWVMFSFGVIGWIMRYFNMSGATFLLAMILGPILEKNITRSLLISSGDISTFIKRPICIILYIITIVMIIGPMRQINKKRKLKN